ncbi:hypothetical protein ACHAW6_002435 [Cyclotella cf. meneghiniana]
MALTTSRCVVVAIVAIAVVEIITICNISHYNFGSSYEDLAELLDAEFRAQNRLPKDGTRVGNSSVQDQKNANEIGKIIRMKQWNDTFTKSNRTSIEIKSNTMLVLPNILLIGAQKAGTTTVAFWLHRNGVCEAKVFENEPVWRKKEVHFFDEFYNNGIKYYSKRFEHCAQGEFMLDATPNYLPLARRVYDTYSDEKVSSNVIANLKLIVILREPISRELSWYNHKVAFFRNGGEVPWIKDVLFHNTTIKSFDEYSHELKEVITKSPHTAYGFYVDHLRLWVELFDRQQLLILSYDELLRDPYRVQSRIESFLGVKFGDGFRHDNIVVSQSKVTEIPAHARQVLEPLFIAKNEELYDFIRQNPGPPMEETPFPRFEIVSAQ